jgi:hypothetical protein
MRDKNKYGELYTEHYFQQYKLYLNSIEQISNRRAQANQYFITVNSAILVLIGLIFQYSGNYKEFLMLFLCAFGLLISLIFYKLINSYQQINTGKFEVLHKIENNLPIELYKQEWRQLGEGKNKELYFPFSDIEKLIPIAFTIGYSLIIIGTIIIYLL